MSSKSTVVIIGASFAGIPIAHALLKDVPSAQVVLINPSPTFYFTIAAPRIFAKPKAFQPEQYLISISSVFSYYPADSFEFVQGHATSISVDEKSVTINGERTISFDHLVIASGSTTQSTTRKHVPLPFKQTDEDNMQYLIKNAQKAISAAKSIVIAGAGPIGVELAGKLAEAAQERGEQVIITLVSAAGRVLPSLKESGSESAERLLTDKKVKLVKSRKATDAIFSQDSNTWNVSLDNGDHLTADLYIPTTGVVPNNSFIPQELLDENGWVKVDKELRILSAKNGPAPIYAAGDINNNSMRMSYKAGLQAAVVAANLKADILGQGARSSYDQGDKVMMMVPVGASSGTGLIFGWKPWGWLVAFVKGKDFLISRALGTISAK